MLVLKKKFRTVVCPCGDVLIRACTGKTVTRLHCDDIMESEPCAPDEILVRSTKDVRAVIGKHLVKTAVLCVVCFSILCLAVWRFVTNRIVEPAGNFDINLSLAVVMGIMFCIQFKQLVFPVVYDISGKWVEIRTGKSSLCDGIRIKKKG